MKALFPDLEAPKIVGTDEVDEIPAGLYFLGIDPGQMGGLALVSTEWVFVEPMPATERDIANLLERWKDHAEIAWIEAVWTRPVFLRDKETGKMIIDPHTGEPKIIQGIASAGKFMAGYGFLRGLLTAFRVPFEEVRPQSWQKLMSCQTKGNKNVSKNKAQQLFPNLRITHATADALLIAECCRRVKSIRSNDGAFSKTAARPDPEENKKGRNKDEDF